MHQNKLYQIELHQTKLILTTKIKTFSYKTQRFLYHFRLCKIFIPLIKFERTIPANICWPWRSHQLVFSVTILCLPRRLEDVFNASWKMKNCYAEDVLKTCPEDALKTYLEDFLKTLWRETKYLLGTSVSNKSKCVSNKSILHKSISDNSKANPNCIN